MLNNNNDAALQFQHQSPGIVFLIMSVRMANNHSKSKYDKLLDTIKRYSNSEKQISSGLAKKALRQTIGKDERTVNKYLKILQDYDIIYGNSRLGLYDVQCWGFRDYNKG